MSRGKPRRKYEVVRTDNPSIGKDVAAILVRARPAGVLWLFERGLDVHGYTNPSLSWVIWGIAAIWLWWSICKSGLISRVLPQYAKSRFFYWAGVALICLSFGAKSWYSPWDKPTESASTISEKVVKAVGDAGERQADALSKLSAKLDGYFANQPQDEKEKWRQYLTKKYPLGWSLLAADGKTTYTPRGFSYEKDLVVRWGTERVLKLTPDGVWIQPPDVVNRRTLDVASGNMHHLPRKVGTMATFVSYPTTVAMEVLEDEGDFVVLAIGFQEAGELERLP